MNNFDLKITAREFPSSIQIPSTLKVTWADFIWSFITVGKDFNDLIKHKKK